jgi:trk system potassium uptake protein TrkH
MASNRITWQRYCAIFSYVGTIFIFSGLLLLTPLVCLLFWPQEAAYAVGFVLPAGILIILGFTLWRLLRSSRQMILNVRDGGIIVVLSWSVVCLFSAWPFMEIQRLDFTQAVFEAVSGWTTTGLSVIDVSKTSHVILLWRSMMQLIGGAGLAIIMLAAITGPVGTGLTFAEGRTDQLVPHVRQSAKLVLLIYSAYNIVGITAYWLAGMSLFDAVNHSFAALSTGGFSTHPESIGHWNSIIVEAVSIPLMILGNINFLTAYILLQGNFKAFVRNGEVRTMAFLAPTAILIVALLVAHGLYPTLAKTVRVSVFEVVSAMTTTGFSTVSYANWNSIGFLVLLVLMLIGGGSGSTAGAMKQYRIYLLFHSVLWDLKRALLPRTALVQNYIWQGEYKDYINDGRIRQVGNFVVVYLLVYLIGVGVLAAYGYALRDSLFEYASALGTVGLSIGVTAADAPRAVLWVETAGMFLGRLEFFVVFISLAKIIKDAAGLIRRPGLR